jgi:hypothetical protein
VAGSREPVRVPQHRQSALVVSGDLLDQVAIPIGLTLGDGERIALRGRQGRAANFERSVKLLDGIKKKTANAFVGDSLEDLIQGVLLGLEGVIPDRRSTRAIDDFENPRRLMLSAIDQDLDGRPIPGDLLAEWGGNDLVFVVHPGPQGARQ